MLTGVEEYKSKAEAGHLAETLKDYWTAESKLPPDLHSTAQMHLDFWAKQIDREDEDFRFPRITPDDKLVADARRKLQAFPASSRYYQNKVTEISEIIDREFGATTTDEILTRKSADASLIEGSYRVPGAYTIEGYKLMEAAIKEADEKLSETDWVMGESAKKEIAQTNEAGKIKELYLRDYANKWSNFVKAMSVKPYKNREAATRALEAFGSNTNSPMKVLLSEVSRNTNFSAAPPPVGWWDWIVSKFQTAKPANAGPGTLVEKEFRPLFDFTKTSEGKNAVIDKYESEIGEVHTSISKMDDDDFKKIPQKLKDDDSKVVLPISEKEISGLIKGFNETASSREIASLLQEPLGNLRVLLGASGNQQLKETWTAQILTQAQKIEKGFPFEDSQTESDLTELKDFLNPTDGKLSTFYKERLSMDFEETDGQLKPKEASKDKYTDEFVVYLNNAFNLRKALFGANPNPKFEYEFQLKPVKDAVIEVNIDGQPIKSEGTASSKLSFPAATGAETGVFMKILSTSATSSTSGTTLPANTSANTSPANVNTANASKFAQNSNVNSASSDSESKFPGNWGLFRFIDAGSPQKQQTGEYLLTYTLGGKKVFATVKPSGGDLFDKTIFRSMKAPQNILK
jgi:type VI protein secretion system component VasK